GGGFRLHGDNGHRGGRRLLRRLFTATGGEGNGKRQRQENQTTWGAGHGDWLKSNEKKNERVGPLEPEKNERSFFFCQGKTIKPERGPHSLARYAREHYSQRLTRV